MTTQNRATKIRNIRLDPDADRYLKEMVPQRNGLGAFVSRLLLEHKLREELSQHYSLLATKEQWDQDGVCVD
jgi:hypothetical protein